MQSHSYYLVVWVFNNMYIYGNKPMVWVMLIAVYLDTPDVVSQESETTKQHRGGFPSRSLSN